MKFLIRILFVFLFSISTTAQDIPAQERDKLAYDFAGMLQPNELTELQKKLSVFRDSTEHKLVLVVVDNLQGYEVEEFANKLFNTWKIGKKDFNNGILLLVARQERKVRIETGYGMEAALTDIDCNHIIEEQIVPQFKTGNFYGGIDAGLQAIIEKVTASPDAPVVPSIEETKKDEFLYYETIWGNLVIAVFVIPLILIVCMVVIGKKWIKEEITFGVFARRVLTIMALLIIVPLFVDFIAMSVYEYMGKKFDFWSQYGDQMLTRILFPILGGIMIGAIPVAIILFIIKKVYSSGARGSSYSDYSDSTSYSSSSSSYSDYSDSSSSYSDYSDSYSDYSDYSDSGGSSGGGGSSGSW